MTKLIQWAVVRSQANRPNHVIGVFASEETAYNVMFQHYQMFPPMKHGDAYYSVCDLQQYVNPTPDIDPDYADAMLHDASLHKDEDSMHWQSIQHIDFTEVNPNG